MTPTTNRFARHPLLRRAGGALFGLVSLTLVVACSNYGTTGSGGTTGAGGPGVGGAGAGAGAGGAIATPSGGNNVGAPSGSTGSQESRTGNAPVSGTQIVPTSEASAASSSGLGAESTGTPIQAGSGGVAATRAAVTGAPGADTVTVTPGATPSPTATPTTTPR